MRKTKITVTTSENQQNQSFLNVISRGSSKNLLLCKILAPMEIGNKLNDGFP